MEGRHILRKTSIIALSALAILGALVTSGAAETDKPYMVSGGVGYAALSDLTITAVNGEEKDFDNPTPDGSIAIGGGLFYLPMPELAVGAEVSWLNFGTQTVEGSDDSYSAIPLTGQALYMVPTRSMITPFATGGLGLYHVKNKEESTSTIESTANVFGFNVGGGVKFDTDLNVGFGVDVRFHMAMAPELKGDIPNGERAVETTDWKMLTVMARVFF